LKEKAVEIKVVLAVVAVCPQDIIKLFEKFLQHGGEDNSKAVKGTMLETFYDHE